MENPIFRKKSLERISSPEQLNDYIRVANPPVWMLLSAVILVLVGICVWGVFGRLETVVPAVAVVEDGVAKIYIKEENDSVQEGMTARIDGEEFVVSAVSEKPTMVSGELSDYALHIGDFERGEWVYEAGLDGSPADGVYLAEVVTEYVTPISFVLN